MTSYIVLIGDDTTPEQYTAALAADKKAGQKWDGLGGIEEKLLANDAALLRKAAELPEGGRLIGVYPNGDLAIRQRSQEIVNARWTEKWGDGQGDVTDYVLEMKEKNDDRWVMVPMKDGKRVNEHWGELKLLHHPEAMAQERGRWAKAVEILRAVKAAGFHVPADSLDQSKKGLVAASDAVTKAAYVRSPNGEEWRSAILECRDDVMDNKHVRVVNFYHDRGNTLVCSVNTYYRPDNRGAVLWLRG